MMYLSIFQQLGIAILLATLVGLERERKYQMYKSQGFGGVRTFALIGLLGALSYILGNGFSMFFALITGGFFALVIVSYYVTAQKYGMAGVTSEMAAILTYLVGVLCAREEYIVAVAVALTTLAALHFKELLHKWAKHLKNEEVLSTIEFILIAFVILPLLPNQEYGPYGFFNPYLIWLMVVFISGISFASYVAIKLLGARKGIFAAGFLSGLISSTALTLNFSGESKKNKTISLPYVVAIIAASSAMFFRVLIEVFVLNRELFYLLVVPIATMGITGILMVGILLLYGRRIPNSKVIKKDEVEMKSPFSLIPALKFGIFFAFILFLTKFSMAQMGGSGIYLTSIVSGLMDVDAITISMVNLAKDDLAKTSAVIAITLATMANTFSKGLLFLILGRRDLAFKIIAIFALMIFTGAISLLFIV